MLTLFNPIIDTLLLQLVVGSVLCLALVLLCKQIQLNATTRHSLWFVTLVFIVLLPLLGLLPKPWLSENTTLEVGNEVANLTTADVGEDNAPEINTGVAQAPTNEKGVGSPNSAVDLSWWVLNKNSANKGIAMQALAYFLALGVLIKLSLVISAYGKLLQMIRRADPVPGISDQISDLRKLLAIRSAVVVYQSNAVKSPVAGGIIKPWILVPKNFQSHYHDTVFNQQVLLHELAHIKRRDPLILFLQQCLIACAFWHPAVYFIGRRLVLERELASDDWVLNKQTDLIAAGNRYAKGLVGLAESIHKNSALNLAVACVSNDRQLTLRVKRLLNTNIDHGIRSSVRMKVATSVAVLLILVGLAPVWPTIPVANAQNTRQTVEIIKEFQQPVTIQADSVAKREGLTIYQGNVLVTWEDVRFSGDEIKVHGYDDYIARIEVSGNQATIERLSNAKWRLPKLTAKHISYEKSSERIEAKNAEISVDGTLLICGTLRTNGSGNHIACSDSPRVVGDIEDIVDSPTGRLLKFASIDIGTAAGMLINKVVVGDSVKGQMTFDFMSAPTTKEVADYIEANSDYLVRKVGSFTVIGTEQDLQNIAIN